ncbi:hypothetical protein AB0I81_17290 [Nonomuraea sp. NPDC050404]|uniref:hypothetical protein n=1 Tax=Nonomuraea sp. NPDC050404 TaxID=3155783 RepID=UPI0033C5DF99
MEPFQSTVRDLLPDACFVPPLGTSADGALALAKAAAEVRPRSPYLYVFTRADAPRAQPLRRALWSGRGRRREPAMWSRSAITETVP